MKNIVFLLLVALLPFSCLAQTDSKNDKEKSEIHQLKNWWIFFDSIFGQVYFYNKKISLTVKFHLLKLNF